MECWIVVMVLVLLETLGLAWPGPRGRRPSRGPGAHRSGWGDRTMRSWPGPAPSDPGEDGDPGAR